MRRSVSALLIIVCSSVLNAEEVVTKDPPAHTFSIVAYDAESGDLGVAVASRVLAVGAIVPYVEADVGAIATQAMANSSFGPTGLERLRRGDSPEEIAALFQRSDPQIERRQFAIVDAKGRTAAFTGQDCFPFADQRDGKAFSVQGNLLAGPNVLSAMADAFVERRDADEGQLADWLLAALAAGDEAGGDKRGKQAAALLVARKGAGYDGNDRFIDLRVDDSDEPVAKLQQLLVLHKRLFRRAHESRRNAN